MSIGGKETFLSEGMFIFFPKMCCNQVKLKIIVRIISHHDQLLTQDIRISSVWTGKSSPLNGAGDFVLVKSSLHNFTFQTRMEVLAGTDASVYTSFVLSSDIPHTIQVQRSQSNGTLILLNGEPIDLYFDGYLIRKQDFRGLRLTVNPDVSEITVRLHIRAEYLIRITRK
ncbi:hypothetical protein BSL78_03391 [Apostichopus japonicus]|uniref:Uncharacterized protein n=1 Tax=Stichopus japonicus TaxID=307972 RepID=A0A2G8LHJ4_STIJA|nr:hypothetical protein BSL78_03391 [Apostichopus japonicus]